MITFPTQAIGCTLITWSIFYRTVVHRTDCIIIKRAVFTGSGRLCLIRRLVHCDVTLIISLICLHLYLSISLSFLCVWKHTDTRIYISNSIYKPERAIQELRWRDIYNYVYRHIWLNILLISLTVCLSVALSSIYPLFLSFQCHDNLWMHEQIFVKLGMHVLLEAFIPLLFWVSSLPPQKKTDSRQAEMWEGENCENIVQIHMGILQ